MSELTLEQEREKHYTEEIARLRAELKSEHAFKVASEGHLITLKAELENCHQQDRLKTNEINVLVKENRQLSAELEKAKACCVSGREFWITIPPNRLGIQCQVFFDKPKFATNEEVVYVRERSDACGSDLLAELQALRKVRKQLVKDVDAFKAELRRGMLSYCELEAKLTAAEAEVKAWMLVCSEASLVAGGDISSPANWRKQQVERALEMIDGQKASEAELKELREDKARLEETKEGTTWLVRRIDNPASSIRGYPTLRQAIDAARKGKE